MNQIPAIVCMSMLQQILPMYRLFGSPKNSAHCKESILMQFLVKDPTTDFVVQPSTVPIKVSI